MSEINVVIQQSPNKIDIVILPLINQKPIEIAMTKPGPQGIQGETGLTGDIGPQGIQGETGLTGADSIVAGPIGETGLTGIQGETGLTGLTGTDGEQGIQGEDGIIIDQNLLTGVGEIKIWTGTQVEYDSIVTVDEQVIYFVR